MSEWKQCKKKPVIVHYREPNPINTIYESAENTAKPVKAEPVKTLEGLEFAIVGKDYVIKGIRGELYPIKKEIFAETYDIVT